MYLLFHIPQDFVSETMQALSMQHLKHGWQYGEACSHYRPKSDVFKSAIPKYDNTLGI